jgi:hypothetical protein
VKHVGHHGEKFVATQLCTLAQNHSWAIYVSLNIFASFKQFVDKNNGHFGTLHRQ